MSSAKSTSSRESIVRLLNLRGLTGQVSDFGMADDLHPVRRRPRFGQRLPRRRILPLVRRRLRVDEAKAKHARETAALGLRFNDWASSARLPRASVSGVATDKTSSRRSTLPGSIRRVFCHCQPTLFSALNPVSIQNRISC